MDASEIKDRESLQRWLETRPLSDSIAIAYRSSLRATPSLFLTSRDRASRAFDSMQLSVLRCTLAAGVTGATGSNTARGASRAARLKLMRPYTDSAALYSASGAAATASAEHPLSAAANAARATADAVYADADHNAVEFTAKIWRSVRVDIAALLTETNPLVLPLWYGIPPEWFTAAEAKMRGHWADNPTHWSFWQRWYDAAITGRPLDWQLQHDIALIADDIWQSGPGPVAEAIARIEADHLAARTDNGERLEINPETGLIRLVAETDLPDDIARYARRKMAKALAIFSGESDNQYRPLDPAQKVIRDALDDPVNLPVELFDACASATRLVANMVRNDVVPSPDQDARISEFVTQLREAGADILAHDPKTQDVLTRRNAIVGNNALVENADAIQFVVQELVRISEGTLVRVLPRDADNAVSKAADNVEAKESLYRLISRIVRYKTVWVIAAVPATAAFVEGAEKLYATWQWVTATPQFQQVWAAILRWLGFA